MKRRIVTLLIFLLLGAIVNIAVAWGCAAWSPCKSSAPNEVFSGRFLSRQDKDWLARIRWQPRPDTDTVTVRPGVVRRRGLGLDYCEYFEVREFTSDSPRSLKVSSSTGTPFAAVVRAGWPTFSQYGGVELGTAAMGKTLPTARHSAVVLTTSVDLTSRNVPRLLPLRPLWPGFATNTLFYAAIFWLLFAAPLALRRWRRIKRGLCPACAYPVGTSDLCTECGKPFHARLSAAWEPPSRAWSRRGS